MNSTATVAPGALIGRYRLVKRLARGGMAELFLAKSVGIEGFEKVVVLKRILPHNADDDEFIAMFLREARLAATLNHPNIVQVHDIGREDGEYFFTMEYLHGENLRHLLKQAVGKGDRLPMEHALTIVVGIAAGLHHAHEQVGFDGRPLGIVHRDVSPSNVIITYDGAVKVVDFGIAKAAALTRASRHSSIKGKAAYMSPEQCRGARVDARSDIFAIALVLQELLQGAPVFDGVPDLKIIHRLATGDIPPVGDAWPDCPEGMRKILERALHREPAQRYQTAAELHDALEDFAHHQRLRLSTAALGRFLLDHFGDRPYPWLTDVAATPLVRPSLSLSPTPSPTIDLERQRALGPLLEPVPARPDLELPDASRTIEVTDSMLAVVPATPDMAEPRSPSPLPLEAQSSPALGAGPMAPAVEDSRPERPSRRRVLPWVGAAIAAALGLGSFVVSNRRVATPAAETPPAETAPTARSNEARSEGSARAAAPTPALIEAPASPPAAPSSPVSPGIEPESEPESATDVSPSLTPADPSPATDTTAPNASSASARKAKSRRAPRKKREVEKPTEPAPKPADPNGLLPY